MRATCHEQQTNIRNSLVAHFACWLITCWQDTLLNTCTIASFFDYMHYDVFRILSSQQGKAQQTNRDNGLLVNYLLAHVYFFRSHAIFVVVRWFVTCRPKKTISNNWIPLTSAWNPSHKHRECTLSSVSTHSKTRANPSVCGNPRKQFRYIAHGTRNNNCCCGSCCCCCCCCCFAC